MSILIATEQYLTAAILEHVIEDILGTVDADWNRQLRSLSFTDVQTVLRKQEQIVALAESLLKRQQDRLMIVSAEYDGRCLEDVGKQQQ